MRKLITLLFAAVLALSLTSCIEETCEETSIYTAYKPIIVEAEEWRSATFDIGASEDVCEPTGFYVYGDYLMMIEQYKGLHIYDNSDPSNPRGVAFIKVLGSQGLAVRNDILYINQYTDLLTFDLSDPVKPEFVHRAENVFDVYSTFGSGLPHGSYVVDYIETDEKRVVDCNSPNFGFESFWDNDVILVANADFFSSEASRSTSAPNPGTVGVGGSLARFTISRGTLYSVEDQTLKAFSLANATEPEFVKDIHLGFGIETIFPSADKLFIGSTTGMQIYSIADPLNPEFLSNFQHVLSCDPVVVSGDLAYVTLWGGRSCGSQGDQLEIIDISDPRNPQSLQVTPMRSSHGLGVADGKLFLCGQEEGLKVYDLEDDGLLGRQLDQNKDIFARDVIVLPANNELIVLGYDRGGIQQFSYSDEGRLTPTSRISVCD